MIKPNEYVRIWENGEARGVTFAMIRKAHTEKEYNHFCIWITNQTVGVMDDGKSCVYSWDYERWLSQGCKTQQNSRDWD